MSRIFQRKKRREPPTPAATAAAATSTSSHPIFTNSTASCIGGHHSRPLGLSHRQERHKWVSDADEFHTRRIRAEANCPRCSKHMDVLFSNRSLPSIVGAGDRGGYQALNICPSCKTVYYFCPRKLVPLQGTFVEIGRVRGSDPERERPTGAGEDEEQGNRLKTSFWEALRSSYGGEPSENWPSMPGLSEGNGLVVHPPGLPFPPNLNVVRVAGPGGGGGGGGTGGGDGFREKDG